MVGDNIFKVIYRFGATLASRLGLYKGRYAGYIAVISRLLGLLRRYKRVVAVDLGCGNGYIARMVSRISRISVVGIDIKRYNEWGSNGDERVEYLLADARYLPFRSNSVDFIYALSLLEHVEGWDQVVREVFRVLRSPGLLFIQLPNLEYLVEPHTKFPLLGLMPGPLRRAIASSTGYPELQFSCTLRNVLSELNRAGFRVIGVIPWYHSNHLKIFSIAPSYFIVALKATPLRESGIERW